MAVHELMQGVLQWSTQQGAGIAVGVAAAGVDAVGVVVGMSKQCVEALLACMQSGRGGDFGIDW